MASCTTDGKTYTTIAPPGATFIQVTGVSGNNVIGWYGTSTSGILGPIDGFLYNGTSYTTIAVPGSSYTFASGVSGNNVVGGIEAGFAEPTTSFLYDGTDCTTIAVPGAVYTIAEAISGDTVVGSYFDGKTTNGFLYQAVPEPSGLILLGIGLAGAGGFVGQWRRTPRPGETSDPLSFLGSRPLCLSAPR